MCEIDYSLCEGKPLLLLRSPYLLPIMLSEVLWNSSFWQVAADGGAVVSRGVCPFPGCFPMQRLRLSRVYKPLTSLTSHHVVSGCF